LGDTSTPRPKHEKIPFHLVKHMMKAESADKGRNNLLRTGKRNNNDCVKG